MRFEIQYKVTLPEYRAEKGVLGSVTISCAMRRILHFLGVELSGCVFFFGLYGWVPVAWLYLDVWSAGLVVLGGLSVSIVALYGIRSFRLVPWRLAVVSLIVGD